MILEQTSPLLQPRHKAGIFLLFGQGILDRDKYLKTSELCAEKVMPHFRGERRDRAAGGSWVGAAGATYPPHT